MVEIVGMPWHWGYRLFPGDSANVLTPRGDPNTSIPEYKADFCAI